MNFTLSIVVITATALLLLAAQAFAKKKNIKMNVPRKAVAGILAVIAFVRYMIEDEAFKLMKTQGLNIWSPFGDDIVSTILSAVLIWFTFSALLSIVMDAFIEARVVRHMSIFFGAPVLILDVCFFTTYITGIVGKEGYASGDARILLAAIEIGIAAALVASRIAEEGKANLPTKREIGTLLWVLPAAVVAIMPSYTPWVLVGNAFTPNSMALEEFSFEHRVVLYFSIILPYVIYRALKDKSEQHKRNALIYINVAFLWAYMRYWTLSAVLEPWTWPLHLCKTAQPCKRRPSRHPYRHRRICIQIL